MGPFAVTLIAGASALAGLIAGIAFARSTFRAGVVSLRKGMAAERHAAARVAAMEEVSRQQIAAYTARAEEIIARVEKAAG